MNGKKNWIAIGMGWTMLASVSAFADTVVYDSLPNPLPGNVPSQGFECCSASEFGDHVRIAPIPTPTLTSAVVTMSSWACESGGFQTCVTTPGSTFTHPITLNIYRVDNTT